jgi:transcriptional regulator with XRE-family HTH domain
MKSTVDWLDAIKARHGLTSDYQLAAFLKLTRSQISRYRHGKDFLSEESAGKVAAALNVQLSFVLACVAGERARLPSSRDAWRITAARLGGTAAVVFLAFLVTEPLFHESPLILADAAAYQALCIM